MKKNPHKPLLDMLSQLKKTTDALPGIMKKTMEDMYSGFGDKEKKQFAKEYKKQNVEEVLSNLKDTINKLNKRD